MANGSGGLNPLGDRCNGLGQVGAACRFWIGGRLGGGDRGDSVVGGHEDVGGAALRPRRGDQPLHFVRAVIGSDNRRNTRCLRRDVREVLELPVAERVVDDLANPLLAHRRHADEVENARPLGLGPHHAVERGQLADGVRSREQRAAAHTGVAVSRVCRVQLIRTSDPADRIALCDRVAELESEVARDAEAVGDSLAREPPNDVIRDSQLLTHWKLPDRKTLLPRAAAFPLLILSVAGGHPGAVELARMQLHFDRNFAR
jgi:hypothetical protein